MDGYLSRMNNVKITVSSDQKDGALCGTRVDVSKTKIINVTCPTLLPGQYVKIAIPGRHLNLCEVQVFGGTGE